MTSVNIEAHRKALEYSCRGIDFGEVKLIEEKSDTIDEWNYNVIYNLGDHIKTEYALLIHADGFVVNPKKWKEGWLEYDYIGSPWPLPSDNYSYRDIFGRVQRVGNSVSLRSKRLIDLAKQQDIEWRTFHGNTNEDGFICVNNRHMYEKHGMKFAPFEVALFFGRETPLVENEGINPFVFHQYAGENEKYPYFI